MAILPGEVGRKVSIEEAKLLYINNLPSFIWWRPQPELPEAEQYAVIHHE